MLGLGVILRLAQFLPNRSLWLDEARLALNIVNRSFGQLLQPLDYVQGAPPGFLMIEKLAVEAFGNNEYTLRLFPLLAGIISMLLFYKVASEYLAHNRAVLIACGFFVLSTHLIYYSAEVKQYSSDVAVSLALYAITAYLLHTQELTVLRLALLGVAGAAAPWFSHPAVFVLAGIAITLTFSTARRKEWAGIAQLLVVFLLWGVSFMALYVLSLRNLAATAGLLDYWAGSFAPFPPSSVADVKWWVGTFFAIFTYPVGLTFPGLAALAFLVGGVELLKKQPEKLLLLASPILLTLLASGWHKYPFEGRFLLFIVPAVLLIMVAGLEQISSLTHASTPLIGATFTGLLFLHPILSAGQDLLKPITKEEIKPVISYVKTHQQVGDVLYLYYGAQNAFQYYQARYGYQDHDYIVGVDSKDDWSHYTADLDNLRGRQRVWILFSHIYNWKNVDEERFFLYYLDRIGTKLDAFKSEGASVYLYDLSHLPGS